MTRIVPIALALFLAITASALDPSNTPSNEITAANVLRLMNEYRAGAGLAALRSDERLDLAAADRMHQMEEESFWSHESPRGESPFQWLDRRAYRFRSAGENLAYGFETARLLVQSWMESRGHRDNILSTDYEDCGIAIIDGSTLGPASGKSIVVMFGSQRTQQVARDSKQ